MSKNREEKIAKFIELLKKYETPKDRFNPWQQYDKSDISLDAPTLRCDNLKKYLMERPNPKYILIGESPSIGARYTGIAMTSEEIFANLNLFNGYECTSKNNEKTKITEKTASIVWNELKEYGQENFVIWNAYAFNSKCFKSWYKKASAIEKKEPIYKEILTTFFDMFDYENSVVIAVGRDAEKSCKDFGFDCIYLRHPSRGGKNKFVEGLKDIIKGK